MPKINTPAGFAAHFRVSRETLARLEVYATELERWQKTINLVAPSTLPQVWQRHFADSAQIAALAPAKSKTWVDLGSGGGFPGLVVAIMLAPAGNTRVTLVESDTRKAAFLRQVARTVGVPVDILAERVEQAATRANLKGADVVSARALAPLSRLFEWIQPMAGPETVLLLPKGRDVAAELQGAEVKWNFDFELVPSLTDPDGRIVVVRRLSPRA
jgi:16S rRNA (guanine527-N7)-methyltransferase